MAFIIQEGVLTEYKKENGVTDIVIPYQARCIGERVFQWAEITSVVIPRTVTSIKNRAFYHCQYLMELTIPESVISIGQEAFYGCEWLVEIHIPESVGSIGSGAFQDCFNLETVNIPEGIACIKKGTFLNCTSLKSVEIPDSVTHIEGYAFQHCSALEHISISEHIISIGVQVFEGCGSLREISVSEKNPRYMTHDKALYNKDLTALLCCPEGLERHTVPETITSIRECAFRNCGQLKQINLPSCVTSIGNYAFQNCLSLEEITLPANMTSIGQGAFSGCKHLKRIEIPDSVTRIGRNAFEKCPHLEHCKRRGVVFEPNRIKHVPIDDVLRLIDDRDFSVRMPEAVKFDLSFRIFFAHPADDAVINYIHRNFRKIFLFMIDDDNIRMIQKILDLSGFVNKKNIDSFISYAIDNQKTEIQVILTHYKSTNIGYDSTEEIIRKKFSL